MLIPIILSGGAGTRLWPVSRESHPKPFIKLTDDQSLIQKTLLRASQLENVKEILTITNRDYYYKTREEYADLGDIKPNLSYLLEPVGRNTAPAVLLAALKLSRQYGDDAIMLVLPADHLIEPFSLFSEAISKACALALTNQLVTFGVVPTSADTGFGYIECDAEQHVLRFVEKPNQHLATQYLQAGNFLWNAGMFCFKVGVLIQEFKQHAPRLFSEVLHCWQLSRCVDDAVWLEKNSFTEIENISLDYAVLEKSNNISVVPVKFAWHDIGSWDRISHLFSHDEKNNVALHDVVQIDSDNTFVYGEGRLIATIGIQNTIVIDTPDALLVAAKDKVQEVKQVVQQLKNAAHETYKTHRTVIRPWGSYTVLEESEHFKIKRILVKPGMSLSLQKHQFRSEHWVVVSGIAKVINGDKEIVLNMNESTFIPPKTLHRLENPGDAVLTIIEVQTGSYLGEDDIVRIDDKYGRECVKERELSDA